MALVQAIATMSTISIQAKQELVQAVRVRYTASASSDKRRILDEFRALTGYHRKHAIRVLRSTSPLIPEPRPPRSRVYDEPVREALVILWEASDRICGKRLKALVPLLLPRWRSMDTCGSTRTSPHGSARGLAPPSTQNTPTGLPEHPDSYLRRLETTGARIPRDRPRRSLRRPPRKQLRAYVGAHRHCERMD